MASRPPSKRIALQALTFTSRPPPPHANDATAAIRVGGAFVLVALLLGGLGVFVMKGRL